MPLVINARIDSFVPTARVPAGRRRADALARAKAYWSAGVDCVFVPGAGNDDLRAIITDVGAPVNAGLDLQNGSLTALRAIGVARVSVGPQLHRRALDHLRSELGPLLDGHE